MLVEMATTPNNIEQIKLANNLSYLGAAETPDTNPMLYGPPASLANKPSSASEEARKWVETLTQGAANVAPLFRKPKDKAPKYDPNVRPDWSDGGTDWSTYLLIGGGILLGGIVLYSMFGKKKKRR